MKSQEMNGSEINEYIYVGDVYDTVYVSQRVFMSFNSSFVEALNGRGPCMGYESSVALRWLPMRSLGTPC